MGALWKLEQDGPQENGNHGFSPRWTEYCFLLLPAAWLSELQHPKAASHLPDSCFLHSSPDETLCLNSKLSRGINMSGLKAGACIHVHVGM